jgi:hypothetical protein
VVLEGRTRMHQYHKFQIVKSKREGGRERKREEEGRKGRICATFGSGDTQNIHRY